MEKKSVNEVAMEAFKKGLKKGGYGVLNERAVKFALAKLGDKCPDILKTEMGRAALETIWPYLVLLILDIPAVAEKIGPDRTEFIKEQLGLVMEEAIARNGKKAFDAAIEMIMPVFSDLEQIAKELPDFQSEGLSLAKAVEGVQEKKIEEVRLA